MESKQQDEKTPSLEKISGHNYTKKAAVVRAQISRLKRTVDLTPDSQTADSLVSTPTPKRATTSHPKTGESLLLILWTNPHRSGNVSF